MVIKCKTESKLLAVLAKLSAETDCLWAAGEKPDQYKAFQSDFPIWIIINENSRLTWATNASYVPFDNNELTDDEFLKADGVPTAENDPVNHPSHYTQGKVECIDAMEQALGTEVVKGFCIGNTFKYLWRHADKNGDEDIKKAVWYFSRYKQILNR